MDISALLPLIPAAYAAYVAAFIVVCKLITVFWQPPEAASKWAVIYKIVSTIALNVGWAQNRLRPGVTGVMVPRHDAAAVKAGIPAILQDASRSAPSSASKE